MGKGAGRRMKKTGRLSRKTARYFLSALLMAAALAVTQIPALPLTAEESVSKDSEFQLKGTILIRYTGTAETVSVPASVTQIGAEAFAGNTAMKKLEFKGSAVEQIDYRAFAGCTGLTEVKLPDSVVQLGNGAFADCTALKKLTLGAGLSQLGIGAFSGCAALESVTVSEKNTEFSVNDGCLYSGDKSKLYLLFPVRKTETYTMPSTVTDIAEYAFWGNETVTGITLSNNLKSIPDYAFANCRALEGITIPYSVTSIGLKAFADCRELENVTIPSSVLQIHDTAFDGCGKLNIIAAENTPAYEFYQAWKEKNPGENTAPQPNEDAQGTLTSGLLVTTGYLPFDNLVNRINQIGAHQGGDSSQAPSGNASVNGGQGEEPAPDAPLGNVLGSTYVVGNSAVIIADGGGFPVEGELSSGFAGGAETSGGQGSVSGNGQQGIQPGVQQDVQLGVHPGQIGSLETAPDSGKNYDIPKMTLAGGKILADLAYYQSSGMTGYTFPEGIEEIGEFAFARSNLTRAQIPDGVETISYGAFYHCDYLSEVRIPSSVTYIAPKAFEKSMWLETWLHASGEEYLVVGDGILLAYRGAGGSLSLPEKVKTIAPEAFAGNDSIVSVYLPDSVRDIGEGAFENCGNLEKVTGGVNVETIRDRAFAGCPLDSAHVFANVKQLGLQCFDFSQTVSGESEKVVVFDMAGDFPQAGHEETAERLSNAAARGYVLGDTKIVVVNKKVQAAQLAEIPLFGDGNGFKGLIVYISSRDNAQVTCLAATYTREEMQQAYLPDYVTIDGKSYEILGKENAVILNENAEERTEESGITVVNRGSGLTGNITASLSGGVSGAYELTLMDDEEGEKAIKEGYQAIYREELPANAVFAEMELTECATGVPITKMGQQYLQVTATLPSALNSGSLRIFTVDRNGQLENLVYTRKGDTVTFAANHLSPVAFCRVGNGVAGKLDASPDTGDKQVEPGYILAAGLAALAVAVLFIRKKR